MECFIASIVPFDSIVVPCFIIASTIADPLVIVPFTIHPLVTAPFIILPLVFEIFIIHPLAIVPLVTETFIIHHLAIVAFTLPLVIVAFIVHPLVTNSCYLIAISWHSILLLLRHHLIGLILIVLELLNTLIDLGFKVLIELLVLPLVLIWIWFVTTERHHPSCYNLFKI